MITFLLVLCFVVLGLSLLLISKYKRDRITLVCGLLLIMVGLFSSLYMYLSDTHPTPDVVDFLKNSFLIIASIGANFVATSALLNSKGKSGRVTNYSSRDDQAIRRCESQEKSKRRHKEPQQQQERDG